MKFYADDWLTIYQGDVRAVLPELPSDSVDCIVTSPPYWGLRDYGSDGQLGLERTPEEYVANMVGVFRELRRVLKPSGTAWLNLGDSYAGGQSHTYDGMRELAERSRGGSRTLDQVDRPKRGDSGLKPKDLVGIPWRLAFALQADGWYLRSDIIWAKPNPMPESVTDRPTKAHEMVFLLAKGQWKSRIVELADGDSKGRHLRNDLGPDGAYSWAHELSVRLATAILDRPEFKDQLGLSPLDAEVGEQGANGVDGDQVGGLPVEHRAAVLASRLLSADCSTEQFLSQLNGLGIALSDRHNLLIGGGATVLPLPPGIYAYGKGSIAIEHPGEVREFDFLHNRIIASSPSTCSYYYDADAVRETALLTGGGTIPTPDKAAATGQTTNGTGLTTLRSKESSGRNLRSVWTIATRPYPGAHFAVFPPELPERCIKAGSSERGVCPECGAPWERVVERTRSAPSGYKERRAQGIERVHENGRVIGNEGDPQRIPNEAGRNEQVVTTGWRPTCAVGDAHSFPRSLGPNGDDLETVWPSPAPAVVLDPFAGSGTTGMVANRLSRRAILIDLSGDYLKQQLTRNAQTPLGLAG